MQLTRLLRLVTVLINFLYNLVLVQIWFFETKYIWKLTVFACLGARVKYATPVTEHEDTQIIEKCVPIFIDRFRLVKFPPPACMSRQSQTGEEGENATDI